MDVELKNNAISHLTTQGATRIYKMDSNYATHMVTINLKNNSYLEFIPEQIIPYVGFIAPPVTATRPNRLAEGKALRLIAEVADRGESDVTLIEAILGSGLLFKSDVTTC